MQESTSKLLRSLSLARAGLAPALVILLLGATALRAGVQSDNFDEDWNIAPSTNAAPGWQGYSLDSLSDPVWQYFVRSTFSFPPNPAGPAGNYAYEMYCPPITNDSLTYGPARIGSFRTDEQYGSQSDGSNGRFYVATDLIDWNSSGGEWVNQLFGLCWYASDTGITTTTTYLGGWGPDLGTLGIISLDMHSGVSGFQVLAVAAPENSIELDPTHQYRMECSSHDGETFLLRLFDLAQPNSPWLSAIADDTTYYGIPGYSGLVAANYDFPPPLGGNSTGGVDATFDNYYAYLPVAGTLPATVTDLTPQPGGAATSPQVVVGILNRDTTVNGSTIQLYLDGALIPANSRYLSISNYVYKPANSLGTSPTAFDGATVYYTVTNVYAYGTVHSNMIVFQDFPAGNKFTNTWSWTYYAPARLNAALSVKGFATRTVVSYNPGDTDYANISSSGGLPNAVASAKAVLADQYQENLNSTNICQTVNWGIYGNEYPTITNFPGLCSNTAWPNSFAVEAMAYLQLPAGSNNFWVAHDDAVGIYSGQSPTDTSVVLLDKESSGGPDTFSWYVPTAGLYPIHIIYEEGGGAAYVVLASANSDGSEGTVVGAPGGIAAYYPIPANVPPLLAVSWTNWSLMSSSVVRSNSNYNTPVAATLIATAQAPLTNAVPTLANAAPCDGTNVVLNQMVTGWSWSGSATGTNTVTFAAPGSATYYRLYGPGSTTILSCQKSNANLVLTYRWQNP
jgi:hypothetical protein